MPVKQFGLGYIRDPHRVRAAYKPHTALDVSPILPAPSLYQYWPGQGVIWQSYVSACVAGGFTWNWLALHECRGVRVPLASVIGMYSLCRAQEDAGRDPDTVGPLEDVGSYPANVVIAAREVGVIPESNWPSPANPKFDPRSVARRPGPDACCSAYDTRGLEWIAVSKGDSWQETRDIVRGLIQAGHPVSFAMFVDTAFMRNVGGLIVRVNDRDPDGGGHQMAIVDASQDAYVRFGNWWRRDEAGAVWGCPDGTGKMTWQLFHDMAGDLIALVKSPRIVGAQ